MALMTVTGPGRLDPQQAEETSPLEAAGRVRRPYGHPSGLAICLAVLPDHCSC
ncbi:hypothetical protein F4554_000271 [Actinopolymorpha rutila]|uniref:Uncharacterized protein n=1 Tax=Actinopolymorpha rutila TaxID=446787 RepID=A0A852Z5I1_9ACTN|nr:hypothetical protein [Actinopolymorpha rutila]